MTELELKSLAVDDCVKNIEKTIPGIFYSGHDNAYEKACWLLVQYKEMKIVAVNKSFSEKTILAIDDNIKWLKENIDFLKETSPRHRRKT